MAYTKEFVKLEKSAVKLTFNLPVEDVRSFYDTALAELAQDVQIKGFRKGKAPRALIEAKFKDVLAEKITDELVSKTVQEAVSAEDFPKEMLPLRFADPQLEGQPRIDPSAPFSFSIVYDIQPVVALQRYEGFAFSVEEHGVSEADFERALEEVREFNAVVIDRDEDAACASGDVVTINFCELDAAGAGIRGSAREDFSATLGNDEIPYGIDNDILGMKKNEERVFQKSHPADFADSSRAGKPFTLRVRLTAIKERRLPDLDDDLAQDVNEKYKTLDDLKAGIRGQLAEKAAQNLRKHKHEALMEKLRAENPVDVPESMVRAEAFARMKRVFRNTDDARLYEMMFQDGPPYSMIRQDVCAQIHDHLLITAIGKKLGIAVGDEDRKKEHEKIAANTNVPLEEVANFYTSDAGSKEALDGVILTAKVVDYLLEKNTFNIQKGKK